MPKAREAHKKNVGPKTLLGRDIVAGPTTKV